MNNIAKYSPMIVLLWFTTVAFGAGMDLAIVEEAGIAWFDPGDKECEGECEKESSAADQENDDTKIFLGVAGQMPNEGDAARFLTGSSKEISRHITAHDPPPEVI